MKKGIELITKERQRQIEEEGWTKEHDAEHVGGELARAASAYAYPIYRMGFNPEEIEEKIPVQFPPNWNSKWWKPTPEDRVKELTKAGALIAAEIDRLLNSKNKI